MQLTMLLQKLRQQSSRKTSRSEADTWGLRQTCGDQSRHMGTEAVGVRRSTEHSSAHGSQLPDSQASVHLTQPSQGLDTNPDRHTIPLVLADRSVVIYQ